MHAFNAVLQEADPKMESRDFSTISEQFARETLGEYILLPEQDDS